MNAVEITEETPSVLSEYEKIPIAFLVKSAFRVELSQGGLGGIKLIEEPVAPYVKDYDKDKANRPSQWPQLWNLSHWGFLCAAIDGQLVGGAAVAWNTPELHTLGSGDETACLWDLRVHPDYRSRGIGHRLFGRAVDWGRERSCRRFKVETQNINVPACRFYARQGCELGTIDCYAYPASLNETQLIWYLNL